MLYQQILNELNVYAQPQKVKLYKSFFKTKKGEYGEGDEFLGVVVPNIRKTAKKFVDASSVELTKLLQSKYHEHRLTALIIMTYQCKKADDVKKKFIYDLYFTNLDRINNWDLVDLSAPNIVGSYLVDKNKKILYKMARSKNLWERRISIISTSSFIKNSEFEDTLEISKILLKDTEDLIHKAVGWMLREVGKKDINILKDFLNLYASVMPRTMLRYSIERFPEKERQKYLKMKTNSFQDRI